MAMQVWMAVPVDLLERRRPNETAEKDDGEAKCFHGT
jgi:hypothetical protein